MSAYTEKFKDPRWQKKRLEILERDEWECKICLEDSITLNVHHKYYDYGKDPWEYPSIAFSTICEHCHYKEKVNMRDAIKDLEDTLKRTGFLSADIQSLRAAIEGVSDLSNINNAWEIIKKLSKSNCGTKP